MRRSLSLTLLASALLLGGCASTAPLAPHPSDPLESANRKVFAFNEAIDEAVLRPTARGYQAVVPSPVREMVGNFFGNAADAWSAVNWALQGEFQRATEQGARFAWNSTVGLLGLFDVSTSFGLDKRSQDFGQTLGAWGFGLGPYLVLPFLGPSSVRDTAALPFDRFFGNNLIKNDGTGRIAAAALEIVDLRATLLSADRVVNGIALDRYTFFRDAYLQRRASKKAGDDDEFEVLQPEKK